MDAFNYLFRRDLMTTEIDWGFYNPAIVIFMHVITVDGLAILVVNKGPGAVPGRTTTVP